MAVAGQARRTNVQAELGVNLIEGRAVEELEQRLHSVAGAKPFVKPKNKRRPKRRSAHGLEGGTGPGAQEAGLRRRRDADT